MLACCGVAPDWERTSTTTSADNPGSKIAGANDPGGPLPSTVVGAGPPPAQPCPAGHCVAGAPPSLPLGVLSPGTNTADEEPSDPTTTDVCAGCPPPSDAVACFLAPELEQATRRSATAIAPAQRWR